MTTARNSNTKNFYQYRHLSVRIVLFCTIPMTILLLVTASIIPTASSFCTKHHHCARHYQNGRQYLAARTSNVQMRKASRTLSLFAVAAAKLAEVVVLVQQDNPSTLNRHLHSCYDPKNTTMDTSNAMFRSTSSIQIHPETHRNITRLVSLRALARQKQNYTLADEYKLQIDAIPIQFCRCCVSDTTNENKSYKNLTIVSFHTNCTEEKDEDHLFSMATTTTTAPATTDLNQYPVITTFPSTTTIAPVLTDDDVPNDNYGDTRNILDSITFRVAITDVSRKQGGGSTWSLICSIPIVIPAPTTGLMAPTPFQDSDRNTEWADSSISGSTSSNTVLSYAHRALGIAVTKADRNIPNSAKENIDIDLMHTIHKAKEQLQNWYAIHQQLHSNNCRNVSNDHASTIQSTNEALQTQIATSSTTTTAAISLDQLWELIITTNGNSNNKNALLHWYMVETRLSGRTAADAAFWFAMSGIIDNTLYELLIQVVIKELLRFGIRSSCRYKDIIDIVTRCAAAGIRNVPQLENIVQQCIQNKVLTKKDIPIQSPYFNLHSNECSILIWHFSTRQRKQRTFLQTASKHYYSDVAMEGNSETTCDGGDGNNAELTSNDSPDRIDERVTQRSTDNTDQKTFRWHDMFADPTRPLIIDVGCGMGISLLGLATFSAPIENSTKANIDESPPNQFPYHLCNFIGVDLSSLSINYANGIAKRWNLQDRLVFVADEAEHFLDQVLASNYPGPIQRIFIQFPTPYRLSAILNDTDLDSNVYSDEDEDADDSTINDILGSKTTTDTQDGGGNTQLPTSIRNGGFMVTSELLQQVSRLLLQRKYTESTRTDIPVDPDFIFQSNCEDVAVLIRNMALKEAGFAINREMMEGNDNESALQQFDLLKPTQRTLNWIASYNNSLLGGREHQFSLERASGYGWWRKQILPKNGCTETEVACIMKQIPIHRCILKPEIVRANKIE